MALLSITSNNNNNNNSERDDPTSSGRSPGRDLGESSAARAATDEGELSATESGEVDTTWKRGAQPRAPTFPRESKEERGRRAAPTSREKGMVNRLGRRFRRYCKFLSASHGTQASAEDEAEAEAEAEVSSMEQLTGSRSSSRSRSRRRRSSSIGSASSRLKMRLRRCTSSPG